MNQTFDEILKSMLSDLDAGMTVDEIVSAKMEEAGFSEEAKGNVRETIDFVDKIKDAQESLQTAKDLGASRTEWLEAKIDTLMEKLTEKQQKQATELVTQFKKQNLANS